MLEYSKQSEKYIITETIKILKNLDQKNTELKEIKSRGFQSKKNTKHGVKALENIKFGEKISLINGNIFLKEEFDLDNGFYYFFDKIVFK